MNVKLSCDKNMNTIVERLTTENNYCLRKTHVKPPKKFRRNSRAHSKDDIDFNLKSYLFLRCKEHLKKMKTQRATEFYF
jgi:hypothetical protein